MAKTLQEYADWLADRKLSWPAPPPLVDVKAAPFVKPLEGIKIVTWSLYGTLLRISDGKLLFDHPDKMRMQVALDKTIQEFKMWHSMHRAPGEPWKLLYEQYTRLLDEQKMSTTNQKGDYPEVDAPRIWRKLFARLGQKDYDYDMEFYGTPDELCDKVAYFFHANLQGIEAAPNARDAMMSIVGSGRVRQALLTNAQSFSIVQMLRALKVQGTLPPLGALINLPSSVLSFQEGLRKPSRSLYDRCVERLSAEGIGPHEILHVSSRLPDDLAIAKQAGMKTALYAADATSLRANKEEMKNPDMRPDRLLTDLVGIRSILSIEE